ncbi:MAG: glycoside hydrolase family 3 C-terminal domain-containing protein [Kouleothrix sp.]|nr:glycoside hydrolase family 3 C-terminal domain-containing protein [Kouleothrix sp.]
MNSSFDGQSLYRDPSQPIAARVGDLLSRMTLDEKIAQLGSAWVYELLRDGAFSPEQARALMRGGIGQITRIGGATSARPDDSARLANAIQAYLRDETRLGIPALVHEETCSGYLARGATCFPQIIGVASTWEPELVEAMGGVIRAQMQAVGAHQSLAPVLDVTRDPRWGRTEETFGEDPYLVARMGSAYVRGLQTDDVGKGIIATGKHFLGYGASEGGMNWAPAHIPARELLEVYLAPFEAAIKTAGLASIMNGYHELDGVPCGAARWLLTDLLRGRLGFDGLVVSDYFTVQMLAEYHHLAATKAEAARLALEAGIDVELPGTDCYGAPLRQAVESGAVGQALIDEVVGRVLAMKFRMGLFENTFVAPELAAEVFDAPAQRELAHAIARKSIVLLKNEGSLLPLRKDLASIAVIGPNADNVRHQMGDYSYPAHIETLLELLEKPSQLPQTLPDKVELVDIGVEMVSVLDAIRRAVGPQTQVRYAQGCDVLGGSQDGFAEAVAAARGADVAIVVVGDKAGLTDSCSSGESRDRAELGLPGVQEQLVRAVAGTGTPVVVVLMNGRPLAIPWIAEHLPALLEVWLPGEEGGSAVADVLFGDENPGGRLPISFPRAVGQVPVYYNHKPSGGRSHWKGDYVELSATPLYPFGYGLSYTTFAYANLRLDRQEVAPTGQLAIGVDVTNTGARPGDEVVQLYVHDVHASVTRPVKELKGFKRISLAPGETRSVTFRLDARQLGFYDLQMRYVVEPGEIEVMVGSSSQAIHLRGSFTIAGATTDVGAEKVFFSETTVR